jgi:iron(III) transport system ATP-binding protein
MSRLELKGITKHFANGTRPVVEDVGFTVEAGSITALVGESGAGKSTLLRLIAGLDAPDKGEIFLGGKLLSDAKGVVPPEKRGVGLVFQNHALFPHLTVFDNIAFGLRGKTAAEKKGEVARLLALVRLVGCEGRMPHELSGGERQRIALARTLAPRPGLVLLDEPFSSLDTSLRARVRDEVRTILKRADVTALLVTHDAGDALDLADRIAVIKRGRIQQVDTPQALHGTPANREVAAFFGACNFLPGRVFAGLKAEAWRGLHRPASAEEVWVRPADVQIVSRERAKAEGGVTGSPLSCRFHGGHWEVRFQPDDASIPVITAFMDAPVECGRKGGVLPRERE